MAYMYCYCSNWLQKYKLLKIKTFLVLFVLTSISMYGLLYIRLDKPIVSKSIHYSQQKGCDFQTLSPWDPSISPFFKRLPPLVCWSGPPLLVYHQQGYLKVNASKLRSRETLDYCMYNTIVMKKGSDFKSVETFESEHFTAEKPIRIRQNDSDVVVKCYDKKNRLLSTMNLSFIIPDPSMEQTKSKMFESHVNKHEIEETLSVLLIGLDGMSRSNLIRTMPKTRKYLQESLNAIEMVQYNKVGDNTFPNIIPLLTGRPEVLDTVRTPYGTWQHSEPFDIINDAFIWSEFQKAGYVTATAWEEKITGFHHLEYGKIGWHKRYTDFTNRPSVVRSSTVNNCLYRNVSQIELRVDYLLQLATTYNNSKKTPYFGFLCLTALTHDDANKASAGDLIHLEMLKKFKDQGLLHNTLLIFFSDHGQRFGEIRTSRAGGFESKHPFVFFVFPTWFHEKYPNLINTLRLNQNRLTTHFDVYATMKDLLYFQNQAVGRRPFSEFGRSLFSEISFNRTCKDAGIPVEFCNCLLLDENVADKKITSILVNALEKRILWYTNHRRDICHPLEITQTLSVKRLLLDEDNDEMYVVTVVTSPGGGIFEAFVSYERPRTDKANITTPAEARVTGQVGRLNLYRDTAGCMDLFGLQPFCVCRTQKSDKPKVGVIFKGVIVFVFGVCILGYMIIFTMTCNLF